MAKKVIQQVTYIDDFTGEELDPDKAVELLFGYNNVSYRMDLSKQNFDKFEKFISQYTEKAERVHGGRGRPRGSSGSRAASGSGRSKDELQAIRDWAVKNGHKVSPRGRIKSDVLEAFDKAQEPSNSNSSS